MTKEQYMTQLKKYLHRLPKQDYEDAVDYFEEYFGEADENGQQELMKELGTPKEAARDLISNLLDKKLGKTSAINKPVQKGTLKSGNSCCLCSTNRNSFAYCIVCHISKCCCLPVLRILMCFYICIMCFSHWRQTFCTWNYRYSIFHFRKLHPSGTRTPEHWI